MLFGRIFCFALRRHREQSASEESCCCRRRCVLRQRSEVGMRRAEVLVLAVMAIEMCVASTGASAIEEAIRQESGDAKASPPPPGYEGTNDEKKKIDDREADES